MMPPTWKALNHASISKRVVDLHQGLLLEDPGFYLDVSSTWKMGFISIMINIWMSVGGSPECEGVLSG